MSNSLQANNLTWISGQPPRVTANIKARIRYRAPEATVKLAITNGIARVKFEQPQSAITPGQSIVFYDGEATLGGGIII